MAERSLHPSYQGTPNIKYLGYQENIQDVISNADCIVLPSYHEGLANILLEGGAIGRALLASDIPGCREVVIDGENGFTFQPRDVDSLYQAVEKYIHLRVEERECFGKAARKLVENKFDRALVVERIMGIVDNEGQ